MITATLIKTERPRDWVRIDDCTTSELTIEAATEDELFALFFKEYDNRYKYCNTIGFRFKDESLKAAYRTWFSDIANYAKHGEFHVMAHVRVDLEDDWVCDAIMSALGVKNQTLQQGIPIERIHLHFNGYRIPLDGDREKILDDYWSRLPHPVSRPRPNFGDPRPQR